MSVVLVVGLAIAACGGDDDSSSSPGSGAEAAPEVGSGGDGAPATAAGAAEGSESPSASDVDPAAMPARGDAQFVVEGSTYDFTSVDAPVYICSVDPSMITVEYQEAPGSLAIQASSTGGGTWQGVAGIGVTIHPDGTDRVYASTPGVDGTFAVDDTMALYEGTFYWVTMADPGSREEAGVGTVSVTC